MRCCFLPCCAFSFVHIKRVCMYAHIMRACGVGVVILEHGPHIALIGNCLHLNVWTIHLVCFNLFVSERSKRYRPLPEALCILPAYTHGNQFVDFGQADLVKCSASTRRYRHPDTWTSTSGEEQRHVDTLAVLDGCMTPLSTLYQQPAQPHVKVC